MTEQALPASAAELLLPEDTMNQIRWDQAALSDTAQFLWDMGVSTKALRNRLGSLNIPVSSELAKALDASTQEYLRLHWDTPHIELITNRMSESAERLFPDWLTAAHLEKIAEGRLRKGTLAWMLGVNEEDLEIEDTDASNKHLDGDSYLE